MKYITFLLTLVLALSSLTAQAEDRLTFKQTDGTTKSFALEGLILTFDGDNLIVKNDAQGEVTLALSSLTSMFFEDETTGINQPATQTAITLESGTAVYTLDGRKAGQSLSGLPAGVYVVKGAGKTKKVLVR